MVNVWISVASSALMLIVSEPASLGNRSSLVVESVSSAASISPDASNCWPEIVKSAVGSPFQTGRIP